MRRFSGLPNGLVHPLFDAADSRAERAGYWLFVSHLATIFSIAASSILLGLTVLSLPWTRRRQVPWGELSPLLIPLGFYTLLLVGSVVASYAPGTSARGLTEIFSLSTLALAPLLVRRERPVRFAVDALVVIAALLGLIAVGPSLKRFRPKHWLTAVGLIAALTLFGMMVVMPLWSAGRNFGTHLR